MVANRPLSSSCRLHQWPCGALTSGFFTNEVFTASLEHFVRLEKVIVYEDIHCLGYRRHGYVSIQSSTKASHGGGGQGLSTFCPNFGLEFPKVDSRLLGLDLGNVDIQMMFHLPL